MNENGEFLFVDVLRTKEVDKSPKLYPYSLHVTCLCIAAVLQMAGTNGNWPSLLDWSLYTSNLEFQCRIALKRLEITAIFEKSKKKRFWKAINLSRQGVYFYQTPLNGIWKVPTRDVNKYEHSLEEQKCPIRTIYTPSER